MLRRGARLLRDAAADLRDVVLHMPVMSDDLPLMASRPALRFLSRDGRELWIWADDAGPFQMMSCSLRRPLEHQGPFLAGTVALGDLTARFQLEQSMHDVLSDSFRVYVYLRWLPWRRPYVDNGRFAGGGGRGWSVSTSGRDGRA